MSEPKTNAKGPAKAPDGAGHEAHELTELMGFWRRHGRAVTMGAAFAALLVAIFFWRAGARARETADAAAALSRAVLPEQLEEVVRNYRNTPSAPAALLALAAQRFDAGAYAVALERYDEFLKRHSGHAFAPAAELGRAHALEALGRNDEALAAFSAFAARYPDHFLSAPAVFGRARGLARAGRAAEARAVYEDFIAAHPESPWAVRAETALAELDRRQRAAAVSAPGLPPPLAPPVP